MPEIQVPSNPAQPDDEEADAGPAPMQSWIDRVLAPKAALKAPSTQRPAVNKPDMRKLLDPRKGPRPKKDEEKKTRRSGPNVLIDILRGR